MITLTGAGYFPSTVIATRKGAAGYLNALVNSLLISLAGLYVAAWRNRLRLWKVYFHPFLNNGPRSTAESGKRVAGPSPNAR